MLSFKKIKTYNIVTMENIKNTIFLKNKCCFISTENYVKKNINIDFEIMGVV